MPAVSTLTPRQRAVYRFIAEHIDRHTYSPTIREIAQHFGINSPNGVAGHLLHLERKGFIDRDRLEARSIRLVRREPARPERIDLLELLGLTCSGKVR